MASVRKIYTLVFIKNNDEVLLGLKTRGLGVGLWNGFGGKVENETILDGAKRELREECNLESTSLLHMGVIIYKEETNPQVAIVHVFTANKYTGELRPSEEMNPVKWFKIQDIPYNNMWPDSKFWYPLMLNDEYFSVSVKYGVDGTIKNKSICVWDSLRNLLKNIK